MLVDKYTQKDSSYYDQVRTDVVAMIEGSVATLLDVGCGSGATALKIGEVTGASFVAGIEFQGEAADRAVQRLDRVVVGNVEELPVQTFEPDSFDLIVCADVLEHLVDPGETLAMLRTWLKKDGRLVVSMPHMGHLTVILKLLFDRLEYEKEGVLDETHLRFYTLHTIRKLLTDSEFAIERVEVNRSKTLKFKILDLLTLPFGSRLSIFQYRLIARPV